MQLEVLNIQGKATGRKIELSDEIFGVEPNDHAIYLAVKQYLAAQRQGTHKVKTRAEVHGSSKKLHRQKGTGGSRKGNVRNPLYKGGGTIFGPKPHGYNIKLNRKVKDLAKISALAHKAKAGAIMVVEDIVLNVPKTKEVAGMMKGMSLEDKKTLVVIADYNDNLYLSTRNIPNIDSVLLADVHTYEIVNANMLILTESTVELFNQEEAEESNLKAV